MEHYVDSQVGRQGTLLVKPRSVKELMAVNALIRLMADDGAERPMDRYVRIKANPEQWDEEMVEYGLNEHERAVLHRHFDDSFGVCYSQEQLMMALMDPDICDFSMKQSNAARKTVAKKKMDEIPKLKEEVYVSAKTPAMAKYTWDNIVSPSLGYSFN